MRARLDEPDQKRLCEVQAQMQRLEYALRVEGTLAEVSDAAERAANELAVISLNVRLRLAQGVRS